MEIALISFMQEQLRLIPTDFKRYMYDRLPWEARMVGLMGPRGVGKSTMVLQHIREQASELQARSLYVSADHSYFTTHTLTDTEVGGKKKGLRQVQDVPDAYVVRNDTEFASGVFLPLWSFGLMY
jgi:predicted AAA+ superfamily ATPase